MKKMVSVLLALNMCLPFALQGFTADVSLESPEMPILNKEENTSIVTEEMCITSMEKYYGIVYEQVGQDIQFVAENLTDKAFGGMYRGENGTLIVNIVGDVSAAVRKNSEGQLIEYRPVKYALSYLESLANKLKPYMSQYSIFMLDANDVTNVLDIGLSDYSKENIEKILEVLSPLCDSTDMLNFIDYSGAKMSFDVKEGGFSDEEMKRRNAGEPLFANEEINSSRSIIAAGPGLPINIVDAGGYTMGPVKSSVIYADVLTAGHEVSKGAEVQGWDSLLGKWSKIGKVSYRQFGLSTDLSRISTTIQVQENFNVPFATPMVSDSIMMMGATSGKSEGTVSRINATIAYGIIVLDNMGAATYMSDSGDSGAPIYNVTSDLTKLSTCYGVHSGHVEVNDVWAESYFTLGNSCKNF